MKKILLIIILFIIYFRIFAQISQENLILWVSVDSVELAETNKVTSLYDKGINHNNFKQTTTSAQPILVLSNELEQNVLRFDGHDDFLQCPFSSTYNMPITIFAIWKSQTANIVHLLSDISSPILMFSGYSGKLGIQGTSLLSYITEHPFPNTKLTTAVYSGATSKIYENGILKVNGHTGTTILNNLAIGKWMTSAGRWYDGDFAELIIYNATLTTPQQKEIENYLMDKYAPPIKLEDMCINGQIQDTVIKSAKKGYYINYLWNDGSEEPTLTIHEPGEYSVTVTDIFGRQSQDTLKVYFTDYQVLTDTSACYGNSIIWNTGLNELDYSFEWLNSSVITSSITISNAGQYAVTITDQYGCKYKTDTINFGIDNYEFTASIGPQDTTFCNGNSLMLVSNKIETVSYQWNTGSIAPEIIITEGGEYSVTVINNIGCIAKDTINVVISGNAPITQFSVNGLCKENPTYFIDESISNSAPIVFWQWKIDGNIVSNLQNFDTIFEIASNHTISLTTKNSIGCSNFFTKNITIHSLPIVDFSSDFSYQNHKNQFISLSTVENDNIFNNIWDINGNLFNGNVIDYPISASCTLSVKLISVTEHSCSDSLTKEIIIENFPFYSNSLLVWLSAEHVILNANNVSKLIDQSNNHYNFTQDTTSAQPILVLSNELEQNVLRFDGHDDFLQCNFSSTYNTPITIFAIWKSQTANIVHLLSDISSPILMFSGYSGKLGIQGTSLLSYITEHPFPNTKLTTAVYSGATSKIYENGILKANGNTGTTILNNLAIGKWMTSAGRWYDGDFAELIIYNATLTTPQQKEIENYLMDKYAPPIKLEDICINGQIQDTVIKSAKKGYYINYLWNDGSEEPTLTIHEPGEYSVTVTDIFGRQSQDTLKVYFTDYQKLTDTIVCYGNSIIWNTGLNELDYSFEWLNSSEITSSITISNAGQYAVTITDQYGCRYKTDTINFGIDNYEFTASIGPQDTTFCNGNRLMLIHDADETIDYQWNTTSTESEIAITESGHYSVTVINSRGCSATDDINVVVAGYAPIVDFQVDGICEKNIFNFIDLSTSDIAITKRIWKINGDSVSNNQNFQYIFNSANTYQITLSIYNTSCNNFNTQNIIVNPLPTIKFSPEHYCQNQDILFKSQSFISNGNISNNEWYFNNNVRYGNNVIYSFDNSEINTIKLISTSEIGCIDSITKQIIVKNSSKPEIEIKNTCLHSDTYFINRTQYNLINLPQYFVWSFENLLDTLYSSNPIMSFDSAGDYSVKLKIHYLNGCESESEQHFEIQHLPEIQLLDTIACVNSNFTPTYSENSQSGEIVSHYWKIENKDFLNEIENSANPNIIFSQIGNYLITLCATTNFGCSTTIHDSLKVIDSPKANFSVVDSIGIAPYNVQFYNNSQNATFYQWNFGNEISSDNENPNYTFTESGIYIVDLKAITLLGCEDNFSKTLKVVEPDLDLILYNIRTEIIDNFLKINVYVMNNSNLKIENIELILDIGNGQIFKEIIPEISIGGIIDYCFNSQIYMPNFNNLNYISIDAVCPFLKKYGDKDITNNHLIIFFNNNILITSPYPNPSQNQISFQIISNKSIDVQVFITDYKGNIIKSETLKNIEGIFTHSINTTSFSTGSYILSVIANKEKTNFKFEILRN